MPIPGSVSGLSLGHVGGALGLAHPDALVRGTYHPAASGPFQMLGFIGAGSYPYEMAYDAGRGEVYVANDLGSNVTVISDRTNAVIASVNVGLAPVSVAYDSGKGELFVGNSGSDNVSVISDSTHAVTATIALPGGASPTAMVYDAAKSTIWAATYNGAIYVIADSNNTIVKTVTFPVSKLGVMAATYDQRDGEVFVSSFNASVVLNVWDSNYSYGVIPVGMEPLGLAYDPAVGFVYVADIGSNQITTINGTTDNVQANPIGRIWEPAGVAYDAQDRLVLVSSINTSQIIEIADASNLEVGSVSDYLGANPQGIVWDTGTQTGYVTDPPLNGVSVFGHATSVTFTEIGLPTAAPWTVWLNGTATQFGPEHTQWFSITSSLVAYLPNGSYTFAVVPPARYTAAPLTGPISTSGSPLSVSLTFSALFNVTFTESGLPGGQPWSVSLNGATGRSSTNTISFEETNGTFPFTIGTLPGYHAAPSSGSVPVSGAAASRAIAFEAVFPLWFNETGLPTGSSWSVTLTGSASFPGSMTNTSTTASIGFQVPAGYQGTFGTTGPSGYSASPSSGTVSASASGGPTTESISFVANLKIVSFTATPSTLTVGAQLTLTVTVSGGVSPFTYSYVQLPSGCAEQNSSSLLCAPTAPGRSIVVVTVSDRLGRSAQSNVTVQVNPAGSSSGTFLGLPSFAAYGLIGLVVALVAVGGLLFAMKRRRKPASSPSEKETPATSTGPPPP